MSCCICNSLRVAKSQSIVDDPAVICVFLFAVVPLVLNQICSEPMLAEVAILSFFNLTQHRSKTLSPSLCVFGWIWGQAHLANGSLSGLVVRKTPPPTTESATWHESDTNPCDVESFATYVTRKGQAKPKTIFSKISPARTAQVLVVVVVVELQS